MITIQVKFFSGSKPYGSTKNEAYLLDEIEICEWMAKKVKQLNTITSIVDTGLITSTVITGGVSITAFISGVDLPVGITFS